MRRMIRTKQYNIIHAHYSYCGWVGRFQKRCKLIVSLMGNDLLGSPDINGNQTLRGHFDRYITRILCKFADYIIVKSLHMKNCIGIKTNISILPNGVDMQLFKPYSSEEARQLLIFDKKERIILFVGNPELGRKNVRLAKAAIEMVKYIIPNCRLLIIFNRPQSEIPLLMSAVDVLIMTSYWEGSPNVIKEAMAVNLPIVSVDVGDVKEVIKKTHQCYLCAYDKDDIAKKLAIVLEKRERSNGREKISNLSLENIARRLVTIYEEVLNKYPKRYSKK